jgi:hypothetical protein
MSDETMILIQGQQLIMDMLMGMMSETLQDNWIDAVNTHNQSVLDLLAKNGYDTVQSPKEG